MTAEHSLTLQLDAEFGHRDITADVAAWIAATGIRHGICLVQSVGSTGAVTTIEYEPGALADLRRAMEQLAPAAGRYAHNERWGDGNGFSHVRSALLKTSFAVPVIDGRLELGTWQQLVALNFDNRPRERRIRVVLVGDGPP